MTSSVMWLKLVVIVALFSLAVSLEAEEDAYETAELVDAPRFAQVHAELQAEQKLLPALALGAGAAMLANKALGKAGTSSGLGGVTRLGRRQEYTGASRVSINDARCVFCQYFVQRAQTDANLLTGKSNANPFDFASLLQVEDTDAAAMSREQLDASFLEARARLLATRAPDEGRYRGIDMREYNSEGRKSARSIASMAGSKAEEDAFFKLMLDKEFPVMRVMCMQNMPPEFYHVCGSMLESWRDIVSGMWFKDRSSEICKKLDMCGMASYIMDMPHQTGAPLHPALEQPDFKAAWSKVKQRGKDMAN